MTLPVLPSLHGLSGRNILNSFDMLIHASTTQKVICSFELSLCSCIPILVYQLIVKFMSCDRVHRCLLFLWSVKPFYSGMTRRNKLQYLIHIQDWVKAVVFRDQILIQLLFCSTLEYYHLYIKIIMGIAHHPMNS